MEPVHTQPPISKIIQIAVFSIILILTLLVVVYNLFAPSEKDIPVDKIIGLVNLLPRLVPVQSANTTEQISLQNTTEQY